MALQMLRSTRPSTTQPFRSPSRLAPGAGATKPDRSFAPNSTCQQKVLQCTARQRVVRCEKVVMHAFDAESFSIAAAPVLIPSGPWKEVEGCVNAPQGFKATGMYAGMRAAGKKGDVALIVSDTPAVAAGVFTTNVMCAAPVLYCKDVLSRTDTVRAVLANAGQANAATGDEGQKDAQKSAAALADGLGVSADDILLLSTGVIGRRIKLQALLDAMPALISSLDDGVDAAHRAAVSITTTDLVSKAAALEIEIGGKRVRIGGICKGSGMIHPNMATMLAVVTCDADIDGGVWRDMLRRATDKSFNQITVDGDTSTNDTVLALANGAARNTRITDARSDDAANLEAALTALMQGLAKAIAWDGEGATCLIEVRVVGAPDQDTGNKVARSVASSSLAKAAIFGHDPNWGRIACAAGYSGAKFDQNDLGVKLGEFVLMEKGQPIAFDAKAASAYLKGVTSQHGTVEIEVRIGDGGASGIAWGCDLSYDYVKINAEYTT